MAVLTGSPLAQVPMLQPQAQVLGFCTNGAVQVVEHPQEQVAVFQVFGATHDGSGVVQVMQAAQVKLGVVLTGR